MKQKLLAILKLFVVYLKIGLFTFGGGYAMIALIKEEIVTKRNWISDEELTDIVTIAESTPGPIAINCATYVGYKIAGFFGSLAATIAVVIPSFVIIFAISLVFDLFLSYTYVQYAFNGIKCAVGLIILSTGIKMLKKIKRTVLSLSCFVLAIIGILVIDFFALNFSTVFFILAGMVIGIVCYLTLLYKDKNLLKTYPGEENKAEAEEDENQEEKTEAKEVVSDNDNTDDLQDGGAV